MEDKEEKVLYKGEEMTPQEFVERMEIDTKKKERNAESIARQKLEKKQEEAERRKAFADAIIPTEEDKVKDDYGPGSDQQEGPTDMSMYQVNVPFDIQQAPVQQFQSLEIPQVQEARLGGLMSLMDDSKIDSFKKGGMKTSKSKDGTITNTFINKYGGLKSYLGGGKKENVDASIYNHPKREDMKYRKLNGKWQIMGEHTAYNWVDVKTKDPKNYEKRIKAIEYGKQKDISDDPEDLVPKNILIRQAYKESRFNKNAENNKNKNKTTDYGLTQINEKGALADYNKSFPNNKIKKEDLKNPEVAKRVQKWYMNKIYDKDFINKGKDQKKEQRIAKTVASYNMGPTGILNVLNEEKSKFKGSDRNNPIYNNYDWLKNKGIKNPTYVREIMGQDKKFNLEYKDAVKDQKFYKQGGLFSKLMDDNNISTYKKSKKK